MIFLPPNPTKSTMTWHKDYHLFPPYPSSQLQQLIWVPPPKNPQLILIIILKIIIIITHPIIDNNNNNNNDNDADYLPRQDKQHMLPQQDISPKPTHPLMKMLIMMKRCFQQWWCAHSYSAENYNKKIIALCRFKLFILKNACEVDFKRKKTTKYNREREREKEKEK